MKTSTPRHIQRWLAGIAWVGLAGCASVPPEAVTLSRHVGSQIALSQAAHVATLDAFYKRLRDDNDKWITDTYLPRLVKLAADNIAAACGKAGDRSPDCPRLNNEDLAELLSKAVAYRDELQRVLANNRDEAVRQLQTHYADLQSANATVTAALAAVVDLKKATQDAASLAGQRLGIRIDTDKIEQTLNAFLKQAGSAGSKLSDLEKSLSQITQPGAAR